MCGIFLGRTGKRERVNVAMNANERSLFLRLFVSVKTSASKQPGPVASRFFA